MAFLQKLFQRPNKYGRQNSLKSPVDTRSDWKRPQFDDTCIRLVLLQDSNDKGRRIIFDSKAVVREEEKSKWCRGRLTSLKEGKVQNDVPNQRNHTYQPTRTGSDGKMLEEMMFGAVGVAYKGTSLKVHVLKSPPQLMLTKVFMPVKPNRVSSMDGEDTPEGGYSSVPDLSSSRPVPSQESRGSSLINRQQSIPVDVPSPSLSWMGSSVDLIDEDSGLASLNSSGSFHPSPSSTASGSMSLSWDRRMRKGQTTSLESFTRRRSMQDLLASEITPSRQRKSKMALGIIFGTIDESNAEANRLFENFFFSHIALFEGRLERLKLAVEKAYYSGKTHTFLSGMIEAYDRFKQEICDLYTAPRLSEPVWLNMMSYSSYRYMLCDKFLKEFVSLVTKYDTKNYNFFMSSLVTAVLTHHLAWVPTVMPAGGTPSDTYLDKHSAKWVDTLAKSHPYNPLWAQLSDLYGAIGFPLKLSRTVVIGKKADLVKKMLYILSYFIRCSDVLESGDVGSLDSVLNKLEFPETPNDSEKHFVQSTPTPVNADGTFKFECVPSSYPSYQSMRVESLLSEDKSSVSVSDIEKDCNSNDPSLETRDTRKDVYHSCSICDKYRDSLNFSEKVGMSTFYVDNSVCNCVQSIEQCEPDKHDSEKCTEHNNAGMKCCENNVQKTKQSLKLKLDIPGQESPKTFIGAVDEERSSALTMCRLSDVDIQENTRIHDVQHVRKAADPQDNITVCDKHSINGVKPGTQGNLSRRSKKDMSTEEIRKIFIKEGSDSMFNEYFDEEGAETKTIDDLDEKDRIVDLPSVNRHRYLSGDDRQLRGHEAGATNKAPSLPDLSIVKGEAGQGKGEQSKTQRVRLGSLETHKYRKSSFSRQLSESNSRLSKNAPGRCRPVTPTELGKRRHMSSMTSFDFDFLDPGMFCKELPLPRQGMNDNPTSIKEYDRNFGRSLLADYSDHYMSDFVLHGTSDKGYRDKMVRDVRMATQYSVLDEPIAEAVCVVADTDQWNVSVCSSQHLDKAGGALQPCVPSQLISNLLESVLSMVKLNMSPEFCMMHLEDRLQEIYFKSKMMAEYLKRTKNRNMKELQDMYGFDRSDLPLLAAIAGTHTPNFNLVYVS